jgi:Flp pilus assembly protein TadD
MPEKSAHEAAINRYIEKATEKALLLHAAGCTNQAINLFTDLLDLNAKNDEVLFNLSKLHIVTGNDEEAGSLLNRISEQSLHYIDALFLLGIMAAEKRGFAEAAEYYRSVLELDEKNVEAHNNLGLCLTELMQLDEALVHYNKALELAPERHETYINVGNLLVLQWKLTEAAEMYFKGIDKKNDEACAYSNLARIASYEGRIDDAVTLFFKALNIQPDYRAAADNLLFILNNSDRYTPEQISKEHFRLSAIYPVSTVQKSNRKYNKKNKIRVGYVSPDFKSHSVGFFIEPVLNSTLSHYIRT